MVKAEIKEILKNRKLWIYLFAVACIPVIYASVFLGSIWDPYARVDHLKVAVVNNDSPAEYNGTTLAVGDRLVESLKENDAFDWQFVSSRTAADGMADGTYLMTITVPQDFSANATTVLDEHPKKMELSYETNPGRNAISGVIMNSGAAAVTEQVRDEVTQEYTRVIFKEIATASEGMQQAADGAKQLDDGTSTLSEGISAYTDGVAQIQDGASQLTAQSSKLNQGTGDLSNGLALLSKETRALPAQASALNSGASQLKDGIGQAALGVSSLHAGTTALSSGVSQLNSNIPAASNIQQLAALTDPATFNTLAPEQQSTILTQASALLGGFATTKTAIDSTLLPASQQVDGGAATLDTAFPALVDGSTQLAAGTATLSSAAPELGAGIQSASSGANQLTTGVTAYTNGTAQLNSGAAELAANSSALNSGASQIAAGTSELSTKLADGATQMGAIDPSAENIAMISTPLEPHHEEYSSVANYASGLAPYFLSLVLYVGAIAFSIIYPLKRPSTQVTSPVSWWASKIVVMIGQGIFQALLLDFVVVVFMGMHTESLPKLLIITCVLSITYVVMVNTFALALGNVGRFVATILLTLQLGSAAGMFPIQLSNGFYQFFNKILPMGYSANGYREALSGGFGTQNFLLNIGVLAIYFAISLAIMYLLYARDYKKHDFLDEGDPVPAV